MIMGDITKSSARALNNVEPEDGLLPPGHASLLLVGGRSDSLQLEAGHWALGHGGALLQVLQKQCFRVYPSIDN